LTSACTESRLATYLIRKEYGFQKKGVAMSEYELAELTTGTMSNFLTSFTIFVSIVTAYVITAFAAGQKLSGIQVSVVNTCFLIGCGSMGLLSVLIFQVFLRRVEALNSMSGSLAGPVVDFTWFVAALYIVLTVGSFIFMWNVRNPSSNG
jgi:hypothetical protein